MSAPALRRRLQAAVLIALAALGLPVVSTVLPAPLTTERPFAARAQELSICSGCSCYDGARRAQCEADEQAANERANPPRGTIEGVCWAGMLLPDPETSGPRTFSWRRFIYSKVRYNEIGVNGFYSDVRAAWDRFRMGQFPEQPEHFRKFNMNSQCVVVGAGERHNEGRQWEQVSRQASAQVTLERVFMPEYGVADTPEERALERKAADERAAREAERRRELERQQREAEARAAEQRRLAEAAEAARQAELARQEAERQKKVDAIADQLGPGKRAAAERLQRMNDELNALRPKPRPKPASTGVCTRPAYTSSWNSVGMTLLEDARTEFARFKGAACGGKGGTGDMQCKGVMKSLGRQYVVCNATLSCPAATGPCTGVGTTQQ